MVLFPEGMIRVKRTGHDILNLCDGERSVRAIVEKLSELYSAADPAKITDEVSNFLEALQRKRIVNY